MSPLNVLIKTAIVFLVLLVMGISWWIDQKFLMEFFTNNFDQTTIISVSIVLATIFSGVRLLTYFWFSLPSLSVFKKIFIFCIGSGLIIMSFTASLLFLSTSLVNPNTESAVSDYKANVTSQYSDMLKDLSIEYEGEVKAVNNAFDAQQQSVMLSQKPLIEQYDRDIAHQESKRFKTGPNAGSYQGVIWTKLTNLKKDAIAHQSKLLQDVAAKRNASLLALKNDFGQKRQALLEKKALALNEVTDEFVNDTDKAKNQSFVKMTESLKGIGINIPYEVVIVSFSLLLAFLIEGSFMLSVSALSKLMRSEQDDATKAVSMDTPDNVIPSLVVTEKPVFASV